MNEQIKTMSDAREKARALLARTREYLRRIVGAVQAALREEGTT